MERANGGRDRPHWLSAKTELNQARTVNATSPSPGSRGWAGQDFHQPPI